MGSQEAQFGCVGVGGGRVMLSEANYRSIMLAIAIIGLLVSILKLF